MPKRDFYVKEEELDDFQVKIINMHTKSSFIVKGCAGSGKSILALWKAKQIQESGSSFLFVIFTKALKQYMKDGISQIGLSANNVENYNQCFYWKKNGDSWEKGDWKKGEYDYLIVDEAQDFSKEDILLFKSKATKALLLYGDSAQQLYKFKLDKTVISMNEMAHITNFSTEQLVFNHRLPKKIARLAEYINNESDDLENRCKKEGNELPKILKYTSLNAELDAISEIIKNRNFEDIGILLQNNASVKNVADYFTSRGLNVEAKVNDNVELNFNSSNPKIMTYHSSKGLQFEAVFLPECTVSGQDDRNPLYVAITRTYQSLYVMYSGRLSSFFDAIPTNLYETSLTTEIIPEDL
jgi:superfamily I DNA/RNA helicase